MTLTNKEITRYGRQLILPEIGRRGQLRLKKARVLLVGAGGLGSPVAIYLASAGVGRLGIIDPDQVELSNLHRQVLHTTQDIGRAKVASARQRISALNPEVKVTVYPKALNAKNALKIIKQYDLIIDGTDNFTARYLINDACVMSKRPFIFGGVFRYEGLVSIFGLPGGPCYRCLFAEPPQPGEVPSCAEAGVLGVLPGTIGLLQANEAIKLICRIGEPLKGRLLIFDGLTTRFREVRIKKDPRCAMCGPARTIKKIMAVDPLCAVPQKRINDVGNGKEVTEITVRDLKKFMKRQAQPFCLIDVRELKEWEIAHIDGAILKPSSTLKENFADIPKDKKVFVHCKGGGRSRRAVGFLRSQGYDNVVNVKGGIDAWAKEIDPRMPRY